jgi:aspartate/methionine/tyrosine aminotransferase
MRNFALETYFSKWEFSAKHHLTASDAQSISVSELMALAGKTHDDLNNLHLGYTETWGAPSLRHAIANTYDNLSADNILCFAGAEEGVYASMRVLLNNSDHAIVIVPNYQAAETLPLDICEVSGVKLDSENNWHLNLDDIRKAVRPNTKLISVCFPNNPTGAIIPAESYAELITICRDNDLYLFSDEVYRLLELDDSKRIDQAADVYEKALSLNVMSKAYGLPGLRIGWVATQDKEVLSKLEKYKHYLSICNSAPSEYLAEVALSVSKQLLDRNRSLMTKNIQKLDLFFDDYKALFEWHHPDGGCIAFPRFTGRGGVENFCSGLVQDSGVLLLPASMYWSELMAAPDDRFRIGFGRTGMDEGLAAFRNYLENNNDRLLR